MGRDQNVTPAPSPVPQLLLPLASRTTQCCVYGMGTPVLVIPVRYPNVERGAVGRPISATWKDTAAIPRDRE